MKLFGSETWWSSALYRQKSLATTAPLQELDSAKGHIGAQKHDIRAYCLYVIDQVALGMRANRGERLDVIENALNEFIANCDPAASEESRGRLVTYVIDGLLNARGRGPFVETLSEFEPSGEIRHVRYSFTLLEAKDIGDETFYLVASPQAIRLYTDLLARDVSDEQVANEFLFRFLVERGEWQKAAEESGRMELLSLEYDQVIRKTIEQAEVNVRAVNWKEVMLPVLDRARHHVGERIRAENSVLASLRAKLEHEVSVAENHRRTLLTVERTLDEVICRHTRLASTLLDANKRFAAAQDNQCYQPRQLSSFADVDRDLCRPLLLAPLGILAANVQDFAGLVFRPEPRPAVSLIEMVDRLLQAERQREDVPEEESSLEQIDSEPPFVSELEQIQAETMLSSIRHRCELAEILDEMETEGLSLKAQDLVITTLLKSMGRGDSPLRVLKSNSRLQTELYSGDDLVIEPAGASTPN